MLDRSRFTQEKTLHLIARSASQKCELLFGFHALRQDRQTESVSQRYNRSRNRRGLSIKRQICYEGSIDFDFVEWE